MIKTKNRTSIDGLVYLILLITGFGTWITITTSDMLIWAVPFNALSLLTGELQFDGFGFIGDVPNDTRYGPLGWGTGLLGVLLVIMIVISMLMIMFNSENKYTPVVNIINGTVLGIIIIYDVIFYSFAVINGVDPFYTQLFWVSLISAILLNFLSMFRLLNVIN